MEVACVATKKLLRVKKTTGQQWPEQLVGLQLQDVWFFFPSLIG